MQIVIVRTVMCIVLCTGTGGHTYLGHGILSMWLVSSILRWLRMTIECEIEQMTTHANLGTDYSSSRNRHIPYKVDNFFFLITYTLVCIVSFGHYTDDSYHSGLSLVWLCHIWACKLFNPSNSSLVPCSSIRPFSNTSISSAFRAVLNRCTIMSVVRSRHNSPIFRWMIFSVPLSSADVASSRKMSFGFLFHAPFADHSFEFVR